MAKADLHVHSKYSSHASEWFLKRLGASESYTDPEEVYTRAREKGMRFVTLTDHNRIEGSLLLKEKYPGDVFTGCESTAYFPEDGCKVHILFFGINRHEFEQIERLRRNIYALREYIRDQDIAYAVAHATYDVNDRLTRAHLEKLILLFDVFEGINGSEDKITNRSWMNLCKSLTPAQIKLLSERHRLEPFSKDAWIKGFTGGSDDHAGMYIGDTYTRAGANTPEEFVGCIKNKLTWAEGRHNDYQSFVFSIYKIAFEFLRNKNPWLANSLVNHLHESLFHNRQVDWKDRWQMLFLRLVKNRKAVARKVITEFYDSVSTMEDRELDEKLTRVYSQLATVTDRFFKRALESVNKALRGGNLAGILREVSAVVPGIFLTVPFFSSLKHLFRGRHLTREIAADLFPESRASSRRILWFTDTLADLNGAAESIQETALAAARRGMALTIATPANDKDQLPNLPGLVRIPYIHAFPLPLYETISLKFPSILHALRIVYESEPDEIYVSTPGPAGLLGLLAGKLLNIKVTGVYHTDFAAQAMAITAEEDFVQVVQNYIRWFYGAMDAIKVPGRGYLEILEKQDYPAEKIQVYRKGLDTELFAPRQSGLEFRRQLAFPGAPLLLYAGRISKDKNLEFLLALFAELSRGQTLNFLLAGDGPDYDDLRRKASKLKGVVFLGRKLRRMLPDLYAAGDAFLFPSTTDTFGMAVLEAQACGLPALVSDQGGPQEIVVNGQTGFVLPADDLGAWKGAVRGLLELKQADPERYQKMKQDARQRVIDHYHWDQALSSLFEARTTGDLPLPPRSIELSWPGVMARSRGCNPNSEACLMDALGRGR